jgi:isochorismate synthase
LSIVLSSKIGIWLGATEQLLKVNAGVFETISLAGTQKDSGSYIIWQKKEQEEQQFVTDYIVNELSTVASEVLVTQPYSIKAGEIWHIKTDISDV